MPVQGKALNGKYDQLPTTPTSLHLPAMTPLMNIDDANPVINE
jgi:hypothetical protein